MPIKKSELYSHLWQSRDELRGGMDASEYKLSDMPDFNDASKLGSGKEMVERLTNLIANQHLVKMGFER